MLTIIHIKAVIVSQVPAEVQVNTLGIKEALLRANQLRIKFLLCLDRKKKLAANTTSLRLLIKWC